MESSPLGSSNPSYIRRDPNEELSSSAVSWPAIFGGATATAALSLILLSLGAGLGLSAVSPWSGIAESPTVIGFAVIGWLFAVQILSGSLGGYIAGRLRIKWPSIHTDEVYFRDTAHGFLSWGLATVVTAAFLGSAAAAMVDSAKPGPGSAAVTGDMGPNAYFIDMLLRPQPATPDSTGSIPRAGDGASPVVRGEVGRIFAKALVVGEVPEADRLYLRQVISNQAGVSSDQAEKRIGDVFGMAKEALDKIRKATAHTLLWIFATLLAGAFFASLSATIGGRQRDVVVLR